MTTTADLGIPLIASQQSQPEVTHNEAVYLIQAALKGVIDKDLTAPPGSPAEGDSYIVAAGATGAWAGRANSIAIYYGGWRFLPGEDSSGTPITMGARHEGLRVWVNDENAGYRWDGTAWAAEGGGSSSGLTVSAQSGTTYTTVLADANTYIVFSNGSAITLTIPANASVAYPVGTQITIEQVGAGLLTVAPDTGVTINSRGGLLAMAGQYAVATLIKTATNAWTLTGDIA